MTETNTAPLMTSEHVAELLKILRDNKAPATQDFLAVLHQVGAMEKQLDAAVRELAAMRQELKEAQAQNHPIRTALQKAVIVMQAQVLDLRDKLAEVKQNLIDGCKTAIADFKENGIATLDTLARFFKVRPLLESMRGIVDKGIQNTDRAISRIETISAEYHQAGRHLKNMGRAMLGKEAVQEVKSPGKLAQAALIPFRNERTLFVSMRNSVDKALSGISRLEDRAKPSIQKTLQAHTEQAARDKKESPTPERPRPAER